MSKIFRILVYSFIAACCLQPFPFILAANPAPETSVVALVWKSGDTVVAKNPLFEIYDMETYVLIPLNKLSARLNLDLTYQRSDNSVMVKNRKTGVQAIIYLNNKTYVVDNGIRWQNEPPLSENGEFYVTASLLEYLGDVKVSWSPKYQELSIFLTDYQPSSAPSKSLRPISPVLPDPEEKYLEGPDYSLGTIRYELDWEYREDSFGNTSSEGSLSLRGDGRAGAWAISLGGDVTYEEDGAKTAELSLIRAKYNENNKLIIFGDSDIYLENTLRQQKLRGVLYMTPAGAMSRSLVPYTSVNGPGDPGDKVTLFVNGKVYDEIVVGANQKEYRFKNVALTVRRLNIIKVVVEKPSGEKLVTEKKISASLRMLDQPTNEWMAVAGYYKKEEDDEWEDRVIGVKTRQALTNNISIDSEIIRTEDYMTNPGESKAMKVIYGADTGIAFRVGKMIYTMDWLVGGEADNLSEGWKTGALYCLERGFIEGVVFYVEPNITAENRENRVRTDSGKGVKIMGEVDVNDKTTYQGNAVTIQYFPGQEVEHNECLDKMIELNNLRAVELKRKHKYGTNLQNLFSLGVRKEIQDVTIGEQPSAYPGQIDLSRLYLEQEVYGKRSTVQNYAGYDYTLYNRRDSTSPEHEWEARNDYIRLVSDSFLYSITTELKRGWGLNNYSRANQESELKWLASKNSAGVYTETGYYGEDNFASMKLNKVQAGLWDKYYFTENFSAYLNMEWNYEASSTDAQQPDYYQSAKFIATYWMKDDKGKIYGELSYISPNQERSTTQEGYKFGIERNLDNGLQVKLEAEKVYQNINIADADRIYRLSVKQALGFASNGRSKAIPYDEENLSFISGVVYLDENGNGRPDRNEKRLSGIKMALEGRRAVTNGSGEYIFKNVEPGSYRVKFDLRSLAADYTPVNSSYLVKLAENENRFFDFGVTMNGSIEGKVFVDLNSNGKLDAEDQPLSWVGIMLDNGKQKLFTGNDGGFYFENLPLGTHTIEVLSESVPKEMQIAGAKTFDFTITETALDVKEILIPAVYIFKEK
jgi:hypothetical protein